MIEAAQAGIREDLGALGAQLQGKGAGDAVIGVDGTDVQLVERAVAFGEVALGGDGLALTLLLGRDAQVEATDMIRRRARHCVPTAISRM